MRKLYLLESKADPHERIQIAADVVRRLLPAPPDTMASHMGQAQIDEYLEQAEQAPHEQDPDKLWACLSGLLFVLMCLSWVTGPQEERRLEQHELHWELSAAMSEAVDQLRQMGKRMTEEKWRIFGEGRERALTALRNSIPDQMRASIAELRNVSKVIGAPEAMTQEGEE